jgi:hypothetical protein
MSVLTVRDDVEITFGQTRNFIPIGFYRFKWRGENLLQFELNVGDLSLAAAHGEAGSA